MIPFSPHYGSHFTTMAGFFYFHQFKIYSNYATAGGLQFQFYMDESPGISSHPDAALLHPHCRLSQQVQHEHRPHFIEQQGFTCTFSGFIGAVVVDRNL